MELYGLQLEIMLVVLGIAGLLAEAFGRWIDQRTLRGVLAAAAAGVFLYSLTLEPQAAPLFHGLYLFDGLALLFKRLLLAGTAVVLALGMDFAPFRQEKGVEFQTLALFAAAGMLLLASVNEFVFLFVALELLTICFYVLNSLQRNRPLALEAGTKYLVMGALSAALTVYGIAYVYGATGQTQFDLIRPALAAASGAAPAFRFGLGLVLLGLGFKLAMVPMQIWAPDVYQGAPTPAVAFLASGSKVAGFALLLRLVCAGLLPAEKGWLLLVTALAGLTLLYGTLGAIAQTDLKRLLGYSSIAHTGYLLMGVATGTVAGLAATVYYLAQYLFTVLCVFLVISTVGGKTENGERAALAGLHRRAPGLALALFVAVMSLAGVPPLSGALGKIFLLLTVVRQGGIDPTYYVLAGVGAVSVAISLYFYFLLLRAAFVEPAPAPAPIPPPAWPTRLAIGACLAVIVFLGLNPQPLLDAATDLLQPFAAAAGLR